MKAAPIQPVESAPGKHRNASRHQAEREIAHVELCVESLAHGGNKAAGRNKPNASFPLCGSYRFAATGCEARPMARSTRVAGSVRHAAACGGCLPKRFGKFTLSAG